MFLITGCGRSGTGWASRLFTTLGYPCGHEEVFSYDREGPLSTSDSSWLAVPHLDTLPKRTPVMRIMRDPYAVVQSIVARGFLSDLEEPYASYVTTHRPDITTANDHLGRAIRYVSLWDEPLSGWPLLRVEAAPADVTALVLYATGDELARNTVSNTLRLLGSNINTNESPRPAPTIDQINHHPDGSLVRTRAEEFGYL